MNETLSKRQTWLVCLGLALATLMAYAPLWGCGFISYDDPTYVTENDMIQHGLNLRSLVWAFTTGQAGNWHPLTWISHILDFQLYGLNPHGHHITNLFLHLTNSILLFLILRQMTGSGRPAAMVAALFALHPLHVESVAWIAERKDVLSTFFWMLTVWAYMRYVEQTKAKGTKRQSFYLLALLFFAFGLMSKPMVVTLPFLLMLLDFWPFQRVKFGSWLWKEKIPFIFLAGVASVVTFLVQKKGGAVASLNSTPFSERVAAIPISYVRYLGKTFWPKSLALLYPHQEHLHLAASLASVALLALITFWVIRRAAAQPYFVVGWLWFLGTLVPVIGIVQAGTQALADRYSYIPAVGLFIMIVWGVQQWDQSKKRHLALFLGWLTVIVCVALTSPQVWYWQSNRELYIHAIAVSPDNYMAYVYLGDDYASNGKNDQAMHCFQESLRIAPNYPLALNGLGKLYFSEGRTDDALTTLETGARLYPLDGHIHYNLGYVLLAKGRTADALDQFQQQADLEPDVYSSQENFADILLQQGLFDDAIIYYQRATAIRSDLIGPHYGLGKALLQKGRAAEGVAQFEQVLKIQPDHLPTCTHLAWVLATNPQQDVRQGSKAVDLALKAKQLSEGGNPQILGILAAAYAEARRFQEAVTTAQEAIRLAFADSNAGLVDIIKQQLQFYQMGLPFRDVPSQVGKNQK